MFSIQSLLVTLVASTTLLALYVDCRIAVRRATYAADVSNPPVGTGGNRTDLIGYFFVFFQDETEQIWCV